MKNEWGGFGIAEATFSFIVKNIPAGSTVLELGAGIVSTRELSKVFDLYSVEQYAPFCGLYPGVKYIHAPIVDGWYSVDILSTKLPEKTSLVFVDGPTKHRPAGTGIESRKNMVKHAGLFDKNSMFIFHDTNRPDEKMLACEFSSLLGKKIEHITDGDFFSVIYP